MLLIIMFCKKWIFCWKITICFLTYNDFLSKWGQGDESGVGGELEWGGGKGGGAYCKFGKGFTVTAFTSTKKPWSPCAL